MKKGGDRETERERERKGKIVRGQWYFGAWDRNRGYGEVQILYSAFCAYSSEVVILDLGIVLSYLDPYFIGLC